MCCNWRLGCSHTLASAMTWHSCKCPQGPMLCLGKPALGCLAAPQRMFRKLIMSSSVCNARCMQLFYYIVRRDPAHEIKRRFMISVDECAA